jgi:4-hydroxybenzoate polyprenyltransferase
MPFALLSAFLAGASRQSDFLGQRWFWVSLALVVLAMVAARAAAMAFNRIVDRKYDKENPRTAGREIPSAKLTLKQAWLFYVICVAVFLAMAEAFEVLLHNSWPLALALPMMALLSLYSYTKRFTAMCHVVLGASLGIAPLAAWIAISPETFGLVPIALGAAVLLWVAGFDILYALQDISIDLRLGLHSIPAALGPANAIWISRAMHLWSVTALAAPLFLAQAFLGNIYLGGVIGAAVVLMVQQCMVSPKDFHRVNPFFTACNGTVSLLLGLAGILDVIMHGQSFIL